MNSFFKILLASSALAAGTLPASAAIYQFELTGAATASFQLASAPTPTGVRSDWGYDAFYIQNVPVVLNGTPGSAELEFASTWDWYGGFGINVNGSAYEVSTTGAYLFSGPSTAPVFNLGTYNLTGYFNSNLRYQLVISEVGAANAVPEPASWGLMIGGLALAGGLMRRRQVAVSFS